MQKVEGSSPFSRSHQSPSNRRVFCWVCGSSRADCEIGHQNWAANACSVRTHASSVRFRPEVAPSRPTHAGPPPQIQAPHDLRSMLPPSTELAHEERAFGDKRDCRPGRLRMLAGKRKRVRQPFGRARRGPQEGTSRCECPLCARVGRHERTYIATRDVGGVRVRRQRDRATTDVDLRGVRVVCDPRAGRVPRPRRTRLLAYPGPRWS
jgi:hypothetical protein